MNIAALQTSAIGLSPNRLDYYLRICALKDVRVLLLGEYVLNRFFHELVSMPQSLLLHQSKNQIAMLKDLSKKYDITIVAPLVRIVKGKIFKSIAIARPERIGYYDQQILINYKHWNEEKFFDNPVEKLQTPPVIRIDGVRFGILSGYEIHFDYFWEQFRKKGVDVVLLPNVATFDSQRRWQEIIQTRAFTHHLYILRANRIGEYEDSEGNRWKFYGQSLLTNPFGKTEAQLGEEEQVLLGHIDKDLIKEAKREWGFHAALKRRGM